MTPNATSTSCFRKRLRLSRSTDCPNRRNSAMRSLACLTNDFERRSSSSIVPRNPRSSAAVRGLSWTSRV